MAPENTEKTITVCFWNILFDVFSPSKVASQTERLPAIIEMLRKLPPETIYGLAEIEGDNGKHVAADLHLPHYFQASDERPNDYIGAMLKQPATFETLQLGFDGEAILVKLPQVSIIVVHLPFRFFGERLHRSQLQVVLKQVGTDKPMVIMGDFNSPSWYPSRKLLKRAGFQSVFPRDTNHYQRHRTAPAKHYRHMYPFPFNVLGWIGFAADDIYVKGCSATNQGVLEGESDHLAVWAQLTVST